MEVGGRSHGQQVTDGVGVQRTYASTSSLCVHVHVLACARITRTTGMLGFSLTTHRSQPHPPLPCLAFKGERRGLEAGMKTLPPPKAKASASSCLEGTWSLRRSCEPQRGPPKPAERKGTSHVRPPYQLWRSLS